MSRSFTGAGVARTLTMWPPPSSGRARVLALLREVQARPDDDDVRMVLADALLEHGDLRGELIALQLAGGDEREPDAVQLHRAQHIDQLLREHGKSWLGTLREVTYRARFARGLLARLELAGRWTASEQAWGRHALDPMLATVEDLVPGQAVGPTYARFVTSPVMTALRRIEVFDAPTLEALRETPAILVHVACPRWKAGRYVHELAHHVLPACERFPTLRSFGVHIDGVASLMKSKLLAQLTSLTVGGALAAGLMLWRRMPAALSLTVARSAVLEHCGTTAAVRGALQLTREAGRVVARGHGQALVGDLVAVFAALPAELSRLEIEGAGEHAAALIDKARRRGVELVLLPPARRTGYVVAGTDRGPEVDADDVER